MSSNEKVDTVFGLPVTPVTDVAKEMHMLLWGPSGAGKTTLASTFPGRKLWLNFDPTGYASIADRDDILLVDFSAQNPSIVTRFKDPDPGGIERLLVADQAIETVVVDSVTSFSNMALQYAVVHAAAAGVRGVTLEDPGLKSYGRRHAWTLSLVQNVLRSASRHKVHTCFICHEAAPERDRDGNVLYISMTLGASALVELPIKLSEVWLLEELTNGARRITLRSNLRRPMKSRLFDTRTKTQFNWTYDAITHSGDGVAQWLEQWKKASGKIPVP